MARLRTLLALALSVLALPAWGQIPGGNSIQINRTPVVGGTASQCLYVVNSGGMIVVGQQACGAGTAANIQVGTTTVGGGATTRILYDNAGVLGEYTLTGSGTVAVMQNTPTLITPVLGVATGTSLALNGATLGTNVFALSGTTSFVAGTLPDSGARGIELSATIAATPTANRIGVNFGITSSGNQSFTQSAQRTQLIAGYTGSSTTYGVEVTNAAAGTGATLIPAADSNDVVGNFGVSGRTSAGANNGRSAGVVGWAQGGLVNTGLLGIAQINRNNATNVGVIGSGYNVNSGAVMIGGFFSLNQATIPATSAALIADNAAQAQSIAIFRDNGTAVFTIADAGAVTATSGTFILSGLTTDATLTSRTVCQNTANSNLHFGSGAAGICLGTSSARYKNSIVDIKDADAAKTVSALRPVRYHYNKDFGDPTKELYGFIAEEVVSVLPGLVGLDKGGKPNSVDMVGMIPVMALAIRQLRDKIEELGARR